MVVKFLGEHLDIGEVPEEANQLTIMLPPMGAKVVIFRSDGVWLATYHACDEFIKQHQQKTFSGLKSTTVQDALASLDAALAPLGAFARMLCERRYELKNAVTKMTPVEAAKEKGGAGGWVPVKSEATPAGWMPVAPETLNGKAQDAEDDDKEIAGLAEIAGEDRLMELEALVMVFDVTLHLLRQWAGDDNLPGFVKSQINAAIEAHYDIIGDSTVQNPIKVKQ